MPLQDIEESQDKNNLVPIEVPEDEVPEEIREAGRKAIEEQDPPKPSEERKIPRQIVGIGFVNSIKSLLLDGTSDESSALNKIVKKCINDFVLKCTKILEECVEIPSTAYSYIVFIERFGLLQQEDSTTKPGTKNIIAQSKKEFLAGKILNLYIARNKDFAEDEVFKEYIHNSLLDENKKEKNIEILSNMFGKGLFPDITIWYNFNDDEGKWQYVYSISAPEGTLKQEINNQQDNEQQDKS